MRAEIMAVGTELLLGDILNTNAQFLAQELANLGIEVYYQTVVGDNPQRLKDTIYHAFSRADLIITTGGLGPTEDDLTRKRQRNISAWIWCWTKEHWVVYRNSLTASAEK